MDHQLFGWVDYTVFGVMLLISLIIGIVFGIVNRKKKSSGDFLLGGGDLNPIPVGFSILAGFISAIAILGFPSEVYKYGLMYWMIVISHLLTHFVIALVYIPFYHQLGITSAYQYLEQRFHYSVRLVCSIIFCFQMFLYMGVALYTPALAIEQVTGLPLIPSILGTGAVCAIYTVTGGLKATVWIDLFQISIMFIGVIIVLIKGSVDIDGGFAEVWRRAERSGRIEFFNFDFNPFTRHTIWTLVVGGFFTNLSMYGGNQGSVQRYLSVKTWQKASQALMVSLCGMITVLTLTCMCGLVAYATYENCDLLSSGQVKRGEQILPFLVLDILSSAPGIPGLFVAAVYGAALSSISSAMNALAAITITDFIKPIYFKIKSVELKETIAGPITKAIALAFGIAGIGMAYVCQYLGNTVLQLALSIFGLLGGPIIGVISLGMFVPYANWIGALSGLLFSTFINMWLGIGGVIYGKPSEFKSVSTSGCENRNMTYNLDLSSILLTTTTSLTKIEPYGGLYIYKLSYLHYSTLAVINVFLAGILVSFITYALKIVNREAVNKRYIFRMSMVTLKKINPKNDEEVIPADKINAIVMNDFKEAETKISNEFRIIPNSKLYKPDQLRN